MDNNNFLEEKFNIATWAETARRSDSPLFFSLAPNLAAENIDRDMVTMAKKTRCQFKTTKPMSDVHCRSTTEGEKKEIGK